MHEFLDGKPVFYRRVNELTGVGNDEVLRRMGGREFAQPLDGEVKDSPVAGDFKMGNWTVVRGPRQSDQFPTEPVTVPSGHRATGAHRVDLLVALTGRASKLSRITIGK